MQTTRTRALAPDLARVVMLLLIAVANAVGVVFAGTESGETHPNGVEKVANFVMFDLVHARAYPMFAILFGYGIVQMARRYPKPVLLRRNAWLVVSGIVHAALLYSGDFLGAYGLTGLAATPFLLPMGRWRVRIGLAVWVLTLVDVAVLAVLTFLSMKDGGKLGLPVHGVDSLADTSYASSVGDRLAEWPVHTLTVLPFIVIIWLGMIAAHHRLLEDAARHTRLLTGVAVTGVAIAVLGGLPLALVSTGSITASSGALGLMTFLQGASGMFAGIGYVALFGLLAAHLERTGRTARVSGLVALGRRSLSGYLFQSVAWLVLLMPFTLDLARRSPSPLLAAIGIAAAVWAGTVAVAGRLERAGLERAGLPGPAEKVLRRLTYGSRAVPAAGVVRAAG